MNTCSKLMNQQFFLIVLEYINCDKCDYMILKSFFFSRKKNGYSLLYIYVFAYISIYIYIDIYPGWPNCGSRAAC